MLLPRVTNNNWDWKNSISCLRTERKEMCGESRHMHCNQGRRCSRVRASLIQRVISTSYILLYITLQCAFSNLCHYHRLSTFLFNIWKKVFSNKLRDLDSSLHFPRYNPTMLVLDSWLSTVELIAGPFLSFSCKL